MIVAGAYYFSQRLIIILLAFFLLQNVAGQSSKDTKSTRKHTLKEVWEELDMESSHYVGLSIYEPSKKKWVFNHRSDNYFTPASNVKLLTMLASLEYLNTHVPAAHYRLMQDTLIIWGGADPGTWYPEKDSASAFVEFIRASDKHIVFSDAHFEAERYGPGWAWDDYSSTFQMERNAFPMYGNRLWIDRYKDSITITPGYFDLITAFEKSDINKLSRNEEGTSYLYQYNPASSEDHRSVSATLYKNDIRFIWQAATGKDIVFKPVPFDPDSRTLDGTHRDSLLKWMMQESDNFIAEHLLLACAMEATGLMDEERIIKKMLGGVLSDMPDKISWIDGSGLSRYNLMTPRSSIYVLEKLMNKKGIDYLLEIFPAGGTSGTLINDFKGQGGKPYLFAKSGTMRHTYCLTGILKTRSGKTLLFSWMNNHYRESSAGVRSSMEKLFIWLRDNY